MASEGLAATTFDSQRRLEELRRRHPRLIYDAFSSEPHRESAGVRVRFDYRLEPDIEFAPETIFEPVEYVDMGRSEPLPTDIQENLYFHLGMVEALSYWKAAAPQEIVVAQPDDVLPCALNEEQIAWWTNLLRKGMGEYFYVNQMDFRPADFVNISAQPREDLWRLNAYLRGGEEGLRKAIREAGFAGRPAPSSIEADRKGRNAVPEPRDLVLTSGGKDSVVTLETLKAAGRRFDCLLLNPTQAALDVAKQALRDGIEGEASRGRMIIVQRTIDQRLLELNAAGYLNGHTPFSALLAFLGVTVAALYGYRRVIVSNERSAEEATTEYLGEQINHQYSKTLEFESSFRDYSRKYLSPDVEYFSLLRPLYELQIAQRFSRYPQYFPIFRSCNRGQATNSWCGCCPKCLFVYTSLYPFIEREQMLKIFGKDLFEWNGAVPVLRELLGLDAAKPFECVGTKEETLAAMHLCVEKYRQQNLALPPALEAISTTVLSARSGLAALAHRILSSWTDQHNVPSELAALLEN